MLLPLHQTFHSTLNLSTGNTLLTIKMSKLFKAAVFSSENNQQVLEHRRFQMASEACNFLLLQEKLRNLFDNQSVQIFWTDSEGDKVSIRTEADFTNCLEEQSQEPMVKLVLVKSNVNLDNQEFIWIVINGSTLHHFIVKRSETFGSILKRYLDFTGNRNRRFKYNGRVLRDDETPLSLNMRRDASIDVEETQGRRRTRDQTTWLIDANEAGEVFEGPRRRRLTRIGNRRWAMIGDDDQGVANMRRILQEEMSDDIWAAHGRLSY